MKVILLLVLLAMTHAYADERRGFPFGAERWEGTREWKPDRHFRRPWPDRFTVDRPGTCELRCVRSGREYRCREYRC
jgi:hypothetical protein